MGRVGNTRLYHFTKFSNEKNEGLIGILKDNYLRCSNAEKANDKYEASYYSKISHKDLGIKLNYISFCKSINNPVMWYFYTEKCTGACLEFEIDSNVGDLVDISYIDINERTKKLTYEENGKEFLSKKSSFWEFEDEKRLFLTEKEFLPLEGYLKAVILAPNFRYEDLNKETAEYLYNLYKEGNLRIANSTYNVTNTLKCTSPKLMDVFRKYNLMEIIEH